MKTRLCSSLGTCIPNSNGHIFVTGVSLFLACSAAQADGSWAPTDGNSVSATNSVAGGIDNSVTGQGAVALGVNNIIVNDSAIAVGVSNRPTAARTVTIGSANYASAIDAVAMGRMNNASGATSTSVGVSNRSQAQFSSAVGFANLASGDQSTALGFLNTAGGLKSIAVGRQARAYADNSIVFGIDSTSNYDNAIAIGIGVTTTQQNQIALGTASDTITMAGALAQGDASADRIVTVDASGNIQSVTTTQLFANISGPSIADGSITTAKLAPEVQERFDGLEDATQNLQNRVDGLESATEKLQSGMAMSYAMSNIAHYIAPDKNHSFSVGLGEFDGNTAFAMALNTRLDTNVRGRISIARGTRDKTLGFGAGVLWTW
jgi:hypothetical protein